MININVVLDPTRFKVDYFPPLMGKSSERYDKVCEGIAGISNILKTYYYLHLNESTDVNLESKAKENELALTPVCLDEIRQKLEDACAGRYCKNIIT